MENEDFIGSLVKKTVRHGLGLAGAAIVAQDCGGFIPVEQCDSTVANVIGAGMIAFSMLWSYARAWARKKEQEV